MSAEQSGGTVQLSDGSFSIGGEGGCVQYDEIDRYVAFERLIRAKEDNE